MAGDMISFGPDYFSVYLLHLAWRTTGNVRALLTSWKNRALTMTMTYRALFRLLRMFSRGVFFSSSSSSCFARQPLPLSPQPFLFLFASHLQTMPLPRPMDKSSSELRTSFLGCVPSQPFRRWRLPNFCSTYGLEWYDKRAAPSLPHPRAIAGSRLEGL